MEDWDQEQLEKVIADKHAKEKSNATSIICRNFLDAVERKQYGWCGLRIQQYQLPCFHYDHVICCNFLDIMEAEAVRLVRPAKS